jgi:hypothetical protein
MIVYPTDETETSTPFDCQSFSVGGAIFIAQQAQAELVFPKDENGVQVALPLEAKQKVRLEMHYINPSSQPIQVLGQAEMEVLPSSATVTKSAFSFEGQLGVPTIPAHGEADTGVIFQPVSAGQHVFSLTTHQHHLGTEMRIWYASGPNDMTHLVADSMSWSNPPLVALDPPLVFSGSEGFAYDCHWKNPGSIDVHGGFSANDEMCFFWHYYYLAP